MGIPLAAFVGACIAFALLYRCRRKGFSSLQHSGDVSDAGLNAYGDGTYHHGYAHGEKLIGPTNYEVHRDPQEILGEELPIHGSRLPQQYRELEGASQTPRSDVVIRV